MINLALRRGYEYYAECASIWFEITTVPEHWLTSAGRRLIEGKFG